MLHKIINRSTFWVSLLLLSTILIINASFKGKDIKYFKTDSISLVATKLPFTPKEFYIADVQDARQDRSAVAWLVPTSAVKGASLEKVDLKGGSLAGIRQFINYSLPTNDKLRPIVIKFKEWWATETAVGQGKVDGKLLVSVSFYLKRNGEEVHLLDYDGGARYGRLVNQQNVVEPVLRKSLTNALQYFNNWINEHADKSEKLAKGVRVTFSEPERHMVPDTVFYSSNRPLKWGDFKAAPNAKSNYAASVFPGFGYKGKSSVVNGIVHLELMMQVFMLQKGSWVKEAARNSYALNHEQRHFDIVKLVAERFKDKIMREILTVEDYNSMIQYEYIEFFREMNRMQEQYDSETRHGINQGVQAQWNQRIDEELVKLGVKK